MVEVVEVLYVLKLSRKETSEDIDFFLMEGAMKLKVQRFGLGTDTRCHILAAWDQANPLIFWLADYMNIKLKVYYLFNNGLVLLNNAKCVLKLRTKNSNKETNIHLNSEGTKLYTGGYISFSKLVDSSDIEYLNSWREGETLNKFDNSWSFWPCI